MGESKTYHEVRACLSAQFEEVNGYDFYRDIFPNNENEGENHTDFSHPNAIYLYTDTEDKERKKPRRRVMLNDTWESDYMEFVERNPLALCSGLSYRRKTNTLENAQHMCAMIFDLDGVGPSELRVLLHRLGNDASIIRMLPMPTYIVCSGTGLHLYYVFTQPIDLYPNIKLALKALKYDLTYKMWDWKGTSSVKDIQYQSINQSFRMVGSVNSKYGVEVVAFRTGSKVTLEYMNRYVMKPENRVDITKPFRPSQVSVSDAREKFPEWYERVIVNAIHRPKKWDIYSKQGFALYDWWRNTQIKHILGGHRYFFLMCMAIYAVKCDVPKEKLKEDMKEAFETLRLVEHGNPLTVDDMESALEAYDKGYYCFTIDDIEKLTNLRIERNRRNGQRQADHLEEARATRDIRMRRRGRVWTDGNGRPSARDDVLKWRAEHPCGKKADCIRDTGLSKPTVYKHWEALK